jgi:hypothetical protein
MESQLPNDGAPADIAWEPVDYQNEAEINAEAVVQEIFLDGLPLLAKEVYDRFVEFGVSKTTACPVALQMGIKKVKRKSGWWWVPPGVKEPTMAALAGDPYRASDAVKQPAHAP